MCHWARAIFSFILVAASATCAPNQFVARYVPVGSSGSADLLAVDASGNFFIVATVTEPSGIPQIRATKTDPQGNVIASLDFGGTFNNIFGASNIIPDVPSGAAVDPQGNLVIVGTTSSADFPLVSPLISMSNGPSGFIVKLNSQLTGMVFSTRLGGTSGGFTGGTSTNAIALDTAGNIYVTGGTNETNFPTTPGAFQTTGPVPNSFQSPIFAYVTEISSNGSSIVYSTFFGSPTTNCSGGSVCVPAAGSTTANAIALDNTGAVVIAGKTIATNLPVTAGTVGQKCQCWYPTGYAEEAAGFLAKFAAGGKQLTWATYINLPLNAPGNGQFQNDVSIATVAIDTSGNVVFGGTAPNGFAVTSGAVQSAYPGTTLSPSDAPYAGFVSKVNSSATNFLFSTYFGAELAFGVPDGVTSLAVDGQGDIWLTGYSVPSALPFPAPVQVLGDTFVAELSADGSSLLQGITAPTGAAGQAMVVAPNGTPAALGSTGSLLLGVTGQPASLIGVESSAGIQVSSNVAPYELVSFFGVGLGPANALGAKVVNGALTTSLGGVKVLFDNVAAPLLYVGPNQINAIVPSSVVGEPTTTVQIVTPDGTLAGPTLSAAPSEPEVFQTGGTAVALNQDGSLNSASNPAKGGSIVTVWATGGGLFYQLNPPDGAIVGSVYIPALPVSVLSLNGASGTDSLAVLYAGQAPASVAGVLQVNFQLPENLSGGVGQLTCDLQVGPAVSSLFSIYVTP